MVQCVISQSHMMEKSCVHVLNLKKKKLNKTDMNGNTGHFIRLAELL